jgi:hypothetical protein
MSTELKAEDLIPLIAKLSPAERHRLRYLARNQGLDDGQTYAAMPPRDEQFSSDDDALSWEAEGWEEFV